MKRKRSLVDCKMKKGKKVDEPSPILCSFIENVPEPILGEIFVRLPIKEIIMCKSVCKIWYRLIKAPQFSKHHFDRAKPCVIVRSCAPVHVSRMIHLIELQKVNVTHCSCDRNDKFIDCEHRVELKLDTKMKIPLRNVELLPVVGDLKTKHSGARNKCVTKVRPRLHKSIIVNSCNGFLCLSDPKSNNPMAVCNPVTGEYLNLPETQNGLGKMGKIVCGFGYSSKLNKHKVIRMFEQVDSSTIVETYTFGKGSWERVDSIYSYQPQFRGRYLDSYEFPLYCNGAVNWLHAKFFDDTASICSFDLDQDCFKAIELPPLGCDRRYSCVKRLGELGGCLSLFSYPLNHESFTIWVMKKYGSASSWTKIITIHKDYCERMTTFSCLPISYAEDASLIMFSLYDNAFVHLNRIHGLKYVKIRGFKSKLEACSYVPTLVSLKDVLTNDDDILNVNTKDIKLPGDLALGECKAISLMEVHKESGLPTD